MAVVDELVTILGVKLAGDAIAKLKSFKEGVADISKTVTAMGLVAAGATAAAGLFIRGVATEAAELDKLSQKTGISTTALQEWQYAAQKSGADAKAITNDLVSLQKTMSSPIPGQFNATLAMFGVSARNSNGELKTTDQLLLDMSDKFKSMSTQKAAQWASKLGISDDTLMLLKQGTAGLEELRKEAHKLGGIIPEDSIKAASNFKKQLAELQFAIRGITSQVAIAAIPALSTLVEGFKEFIAANREFISLGLSALMGGIVGGFERFVDVVKNIVSVFSPLIDTVREFLPEMDGAELVTHLVTGALTGLLIVFSPLIAKFALVGAAVVAASAVFEDFFTFLEGGDSVIGHFFDAFAQRWPDLFSALSSLWTWISSNITPALDALVGVVSYVGQAFASVGATILDVFNSISGPIAEFFSTFEERFPALAAVLQEIAGLIGQGLKAAFDTVIAVIQGVIGAIGDLLGVVGSAITKIAEFLNWLFDSEEESNKKSGSVAKTGDKYTVPEGDTAPAAEAASATPSKRRYRGDRFADEDDDEGPSYSAERFTASPEAARLANTQQAPAGGGEQQMQYNDNKTITINVSTSDPAQAANMTASAINSNSSVNVNTPGANAPRAM